MPKLTPYTFKDSGNTVLIKPISPLLLMKIQSKFIPPQPPSQEVDYGDGVKKLEKNYASPEYASAMQKYNQDVERMLRDFIIDLGIVVTLDDDQKKQVNELREFWKKTFEEELNESDTKIFVSYLCIQSTQDLQDLITAVTTRSSPTEEVVKNIQDSFPGGDTPKVD